MRSTATSIALVVLCGLALLASPARADSLIDEIKELRPLEMRRTPPGCPLPVVGAQCPEENVLYYFKCCGELNSACCFRLQDWVVVLLAVVTGLVVLSLIVNFIRCLFC